jgi:hypothetical protein
MANVNRPQGLKPVKSLIAGDYDGRGNVYHIISTDATYSYYVGDVVQLTGTGDANGIPGIEKFTPNDAAGGSGINGAGPVGVIMAIGTSASGPWINPSDLTKISAPITKAQDYYALVADDPFLIFEVQEGGSGTALAATAIGLNCNLSYTANQTTGYWSTTILDNASEVATIGLDVRLMGLAQVTGNAFGYYARWNVMLNSHAYKMTTGI